VLGVRFCVVRFRRGAPHIGGAHTKFKANKRFVMRGGVNPPRA
jgi:hypothetical protein